MATPLRRDLIMISGSAYHLVDRLMLAIRQVPYLDSKKNHIVVCDVDGILRNYKNGKVMIIEHKCRLQYPSFAEEGTLKWLANSLQNNPSFMGLYLIQYENETPTDGYHQLSVWRDNKWMTIPSGSTNPTTHLTDENIYRFISNKMS